MIRKCNICNEPKSKLFRCRYGNMKSWVFLCQICLTDVKLKFSDSYQYGGTKNYDRKQQ